MKIQAVKGTRDLYPELLAPIRHICDAWRRVSLRHGFQEFDGPTLETLELYREKSGEELVGQLYRLTDSGGRELALRPEMTPTLARMVAARINTLPKPIKWFCIPTLFRGENVQRGRLREFLQWNVDVIGEADVVADAECILVGVEALRELGLRHTDFAVHISSRRLIAALLRSAQIGNDALPAAYSLIDKAGKLPEAEMAERWNPMFGEKLSYDRLTKLLAAASVEAAEGFVSAAGWTPDADLAAAADEARRLITILHDFGITEYCIYDMRVVRGLAYYTGPVFEFYDRSAKERAICGGGRYDDLLGKLSKSREPAVGFGMGDVVLALMLEERGLLTARTAAPTVFVADAAEGLRSVVHRVVAEVRRAGLATDFLYGFAPLGKQLKLADKRAATKVIVIGSETEQRGVVQLKDMVGGQTREAPLDKLLADPKGVLGV